MSDKTEVLEKLDTGKLIDIAKNFEYYGYEEKIALTARHILEQRGIDQDDLALAGDSKTDRAEIAMSALKAFSVSTLIGLLFYCALFTRAGWEMAWLGMDGPTYFLVFMLLSAGFLLSFVKAFFDYRDFYRAIGRDTDTADYAIFFLLGLPFYLIFYFYYRSKMKDALKGME